MPQPRPVVLNYDLTMPADSFGPQPRKIAVAPNDTIHFRLGLSTRAAHPHCRLRITLHNAAHFSQGVLSHGPGQNNEAPLVLTVLPGIAAAAGQVITGYKCELLDQAGNPIPGFVSDGTTGGDIVPDTGAN